jgi:hypothetical protein
MGAVTPGTYPGGTFVYLNNGNNFSRLTTEPWTPYGDFDLAFIATFGQAGPQRRTVRIADVTAGCGELIVPVTLLSEGNENALGFSIAFDPTLLSNPQIALGSDASQAMLIVNDLQAANGRLGIALALEGGQSFNGGNNEVVRITFSIQPPITDTVTEIGFADEPVYREVSDPLANVLSAEYESGATTIPGGYEGDVAPRPNGNHNGFVTITDWVQVGRFAAQLDAPELGSEFRRADCAPLATCGDGEISMADWVQAGRFAAGLDPVKPSGGAAGPLAMPGMIAELAGPAERTLRIVDATMQRNSVNSVSVELAAAGNENALGFSLSFDPTILRFAGVSLTAAAAGGTLLVNTNFTGAGRVALALALPAGQTFLAGTHQIVQARFAVSPSATSARTALNFGQQPIRGEVADSRAQPVSANYVNGTVLILSGNSALRLLAPQRLANGTVRLLAVNQDGSPVDPARVAKIQFRVSNWLSSPVNTWAPITSPPVLVNGAVRIDDPQAMNYRQRFYSVIENP